MRTLPETQKFPYQEDKITSRDHQDLADYLKNLIVKLQNLYSEVADVVNQNRFPDYISQDAQPTPDEGQLMVWKDSDATTGNPTHFLVFNDGGTIRTWGSDQVVP